MNDKDDFLKKNIRDFYKLRKPFPDVYQHYEEMLNADKLKIPYREDRTKREKTMEEQHYSLAFQGGGAKGLAYVGAYRALKENRKFVETDQILNSIRHAVSVGDPRIINYRPENL